MFLQIFITNSRFARCDQTDNEDLSGSVHAYDAWISVEIKEYPWASCPKNIDLSALKETVGITEEGGHDKKIGDVLPLLIISMVIIIK